MPSRLIHSLAPDQTDAFECDWVCQTLLPTLHVHQLQLSANDGSQYAHLPAEAVKRTMDGTTQLTVEDLMGWSKARELANQQGTTHACQQSVYLRLCLAAVRGAAKRCTSSSLLETLSGESHLCQYAHHAGQQPS